MPCKVCPGPRRGLDGDDDDDVGDDDDDDVDADFPIETLQFSMAHRSISIIQS